MNTLYTDPSDRHKCIIELAHRYADSIVDNESDPRRPVLSMAYIIGAEATLHRVCCTIDFASKLGEITPLQARRIIGAIEQIEQTMP